MDKVDRINDTPTTTGDIEFRRRDAAYWYATGRGLDHELAHSFALAHMGEALAYKCGATGMLPGVITSFDAWCAR